MSADAGALQTRKARTQPEWVRQWTKGETLLAWLFILPSLIGFIVFYAVPAIRGLFISFTNWDMLRPAEFVGAANYQQLLGDEQFWHALRMTLYYVVLNIPLQTIVAIALAVMMDRLTKSLFVRGVLVLPWLLPPVVVALIWLWILDPSLGIANHFLGFFGIPRQGFLGSVV